MRRLPERILIAALLFSPSAFAETVTGLSVGSSIGANLDVGSQLPVKVGGLVNLQSQMPAPGRWKDLGIFFEGSLRFASVSYSINGQNRAGTYFALTGGGGYSRDIGLGWSILGSLHLIPFSTMIVASSSRTVVNGEVVKYASLSRYEGGFGFQERLNLRKKLSLFGWKFLGVFLGLSHMQHNYARRSNESVVSDSSLRVKDKISESTPSKLTMMVMEAGITVEL